MMRKPSRHKQRGFFVLPAGMGVLASGGGSSGSVCPNYTLVILQETTTVYSPPVGSAAVLQELPCPYTPPTPL